MADILLTREMRRQGLQPGEVRLWQRQGRLERVRRGAYSLPTTAEQSVADRHRQLISATVPQLHSGAVISHGSAAVLHLLPIWPEAVDRVHVTRSRSGGGKRRTVVWVHGAPLPDEDRVVIDGIAVTSLARTVADLSRTLPFEQAVAAGDRALASGLSRTALEEQLVARDGWQGIRQARRTVAFLDQRSESVGESVSRVRCHEESLPPATLQYEVFDHAGKLIGRSDFCWEEQRTLGEFDGKIKYGRLLRPTQSIQDVIYQEKLREDALRDAGWQVVRWTWPDLYQPGLLADRLRRAFARTALTTG